MDRVREKKLKAPMIIEANWQIEKQKHVPKYAPESNACSRGSTTEEDLVMFELGQSSSKGVTGKPMKKLLAEEMLKETEVKRRSPSVIARLMGLDGMPSPLHVHRQHKRLSDNYQQRTASIGIQKIGQLYEAQLNRKKSVEEQEFKDVYEDPEASHFISHRYSSKWPADSMLSKKELALIQQKFMDAKHISSDKRVQGSDEFRDTLERRDSNQELLQKFLQQPDSMFVKHLRDLQGAPSSSQCSRIAVLDSSNSAKYEANAKGWKSERETSRKHRIGYHWKHEDGLLSHPNNHGTHSLKSSKIRLKEKEEADGFPTPIVVLKPNRGKTCSAFKSVSSPDFSHAYMLDWRKLSECMSVRHGGAGSWGKRDSSNDVGFLRRFREAREVAKEVTKQLREALGSWPINLSYSKTRGYAEDESLYNKSGSDSDSESEVMTPTSRNSFDWNNRRTSSSSSTEFSVSREAKMRLSERWIMTRKYQDMEVVGKGSTLGDMLAISDKEIRPENFDSMMGLNRTSDGLTINNGTGGWDGPLGISSRDGWKKGYIKNSSRSRSRSVPPSFDRRSNRTSAQYECLGDDRLLLLKEARNRGRSKAVKGSFNQKEDFSSKNLRSSSKKSQSSRKGHVCSPDSLPETHSRQNQIEVNLEKKVPFEQKPMVSQTSNSVTRTGSVVDAVVCTDQESITMSSESPDDLLPNLSAHMLGNGDSFARDQEDSNPQEPSVGPAEGGSVPQQCPLPEPNCSESSKEADHPSPVSVLEVHSTDVSSGSECFERVNADLHELRMQIQLLKMESGACAEVPMLMSSGEEAGDGSVVVPEEDGIVQHDSWESSYLADLLIDSGFNDSDLDTFIATLHSPDCPLGAWVFDDLEKYYDETTWTRSERKLLFDRTNSAFSEIFHWFMNPPPPWVKPVTIGIHSKWHKEEVKDQLCKLLARQEEEATFGISEKALDREMHWLDSGEKVDIIGMEIEKLLIDDLITEVVVM